MTSLLPDSQYGVEFAEKGKPCTGIVIAESTIVNPEQDPPASWWKERPKEAGDEPRK